MPVPSEGSANIPRISIVVPIKNGRQHISRTLDILDEALKAFSAEVIVVVNGSEDETAKEAHLAIARLTNVAIRVIEVHQPIGKAAALCLGFTKCSAQVVGFVDGDIGEYGKPFATADIRKMATIINGPMCLIAQRRRRACRYRAIISRVYNGLVRVLFSLPINDVQCGLKLFNRTCLIRALPYLSAAGFEIDAKIVSLAWKWGYEVRTYHIEWDSSAPVKLYQAVKLVLFVGIGMAYRPLRFRMRVWDRA